MGMISRIRIGAYLIIALGSGLSLQGEVPAEAQDLLDKLGVFESETRMTLNDRIIANQAAAVTLFEGHLASETKAGNLEGALALRDLVQSLRAGEEVVPKKGLPSNSGAALQKLDAYERMEEANATARIKQKREAVLSFLEQRVISETQAGNLDKAAALQASIVSMRSGGTSAAPMTTVLPLGVAPDIPKEAVLYRGHHFKIIEIEDSIPWQEARKRCQQVGGDLGWLDGARDVQMLRDLLRPIIDKRGHAPIWVGGRRDAEGKWRWLSGEEVAPDTWLKEEERMAPKGRDYMLRWIGSFKASGSDASRVIGYLCRWE